MSRRRYLVPFIWLEVGLLLVACGDNTATPQPPTAVPTIATTTTVPVTTAAPATTVATSVVTTTTATTVATTEAVAKSPVEFVSKFTGAPEKLSYPTAVAFDKQNNMYVVEAGSSQIMKFDASGQLLKKWGGKGSEDSQFRISGYVFGGLGIDSKGNVYVSDIVNSRVQKYDADGNFLARWGTEGMENGQLQCVATLAVDSQDNILTLDFYPDLTKTLNRLQKFDSNGKYLASLEGTGTTDGKWLGTIMLALDKQDSIYLADRGNARVVKLDKDLRFRMNMGGTGIFKDPSGIAVDESGHVFVTDPPAANVKVFDGSGKLLGTFGGKGSGNGQFGKPFAVAVDQQGYIYVTDLINENIQKFRFVG